METRCSWLPRFAVKGQGCWKHVLSLTVTAALWTLTGCSLQAHDGLPSPSPLTQSPPSHSPASSSTSALRLSARTSQTHFDSAADTISNTERSPQQQTDVSDSSTFDFPTVTFFSTSTFSGSLESSFPSDADILSSSSAFPGTQPQPFLELSIESTNFLDSVAASLRWNPAEEFSRMTRLDSRPQTPTPVFVSTSAPHAGVSAPEEPTSGVLLQATSSSVWFAGDTPTLTPTVGLPLESSEIEPSASMPLPSSQDKMIPANSTQSSTDFIMASGETMSVMSSPAGMSSLGSEGGGNGSCADTDTGCVEYRGREDEEEEETRIKIIVGVACGVILLLVVVAITVTCILRRRGKISTGSKIDLSSYWDDNVTLSYINGHIDIPKDSADEMISLDNDSFLNSLDSVSFTNTWTSDASKHTNF